MGHTVLDRIDHQAREREKNEMEGGIEEGEQERERIGKRRHRSTESSMERSVVERERELERAWMWEWELLNGASTAEYSAVQTGLFCVQSRETSKHKKKKKKNNKIK